MFAELIKDRPKIIRIRKKNACLRKRKQKLVLDSFRGHLMPSVKNTVKELNIDLVVISC